ncbi:hypothetical protein [Kordiimonas aestuarii]|uniref:hypothetical protein n=1 Tax=Kordiimonas aestuarii TaxID=1005925 RepID=UPI0021CDF7DF|nr:hypothetical protein [Kordiimonas aestuarii]
MSQPHTAAKPSTIRTPWQIFKVPAALAALSLLGLVSALTGDGLRDALSWAGLAAPVVVTLWALKARRR